MEAKNPKRYSKQREAILQVLEDTKAHPTASTIYEEVRKEIPNISLGTIYRNLGNRIAVNVNRRNGSIVS